MKKIAYITVILCMLLACGPRKEYREALLQAEAMMDDFPDSALHLLEQMKDTMQHAGKADRMFYELLLADAQNKSYVDFTTDSIMKEVVRYYDRHGSANERMRAHYLLGCTYRDMGEAPMALQCYQDAVESVDTTRNDCLSLLYRIHGQMSDLYYNEYLPKEAMAEMIKAERLAWTAGDTLSALIFYERRANVYDMIEQPDSAIIIRKKGIKRFLDYGYDHEAFIAEGGLIQSLVKAQGYNELPAYLKEYERKSGLFDNSGNIRKGYELYYYAQGMYYMNVSSLDSSKYYFHKLIQESSNVNDSLAASEGLRVLYIKEGVSDSVAEYANRCISLINRLYDMSTARNMQQISALYNYSRQERLFQESEKEAFRLRSLSIGLVAMIVTGLLLFLYFFEHSQKKINKIRSEYNKVRIKLLQKDNDGQTKAFLEQQIKKMEANHPFLIDDRLKDSSIYARFNAIGKGNDTDHASMQDLKDIRQLMDEVHPRFSAFLSEKCCNLTTSDYDLCILTRLHFSNSEISNILGKQSAHVSVYQKRLLNKIFGIKGTSRDLEYRLMRIS